jgi:hypothetical protein
MTSEDLDEVFCSDETSDASEEQTDDFDIDVDLRFIEGASFDIEEDCHA